MATNGQHLHQMSHQVSEVLVKSHMEDYDASSSVVGGGSHGGGDNESVSIDNQSSNSPSSDTRTSTSGNTGSNANENIFQKERGALSGARCCFIMTLIVAASALATVVSLVTTNEQTQAFTEAFDATADAVIDGSADNVRAVFEVLESLSLTSTTFIKQQAIDNAGTYPPGFMTIPNTEYILGNAREASRAFLLSYTPYVASGQSNYRSWDTYAQEHSSWVAEAYGVDQDLKAGFEQNNIVNTTTTTSTKNSTGQGGRDIRHHHRHLASDAEFYPTIWKFNRYNEDGDIIPTPGQEFDGAVMLSCTEYEDIAAANPTANIEVGPESPANGPFAPIWQVSPPPNPNQHSNLNFNMQADPIFQHATHTMLTTRQTSFHDMCSSVVNGWIDDSIYSNQVATMVTTPAFADYSDTAPIVGFFLAVMSWDSFFENILIHNDLPVDVVMQNECRGVPFTYQIRGRNVTLLDRTGDAHTNNEEFNAMAITAVFAEFAAEADDEAQNETLACVSTYTMTIYPTEEFKQAYTNSDPLLYTLAVLGIFLFTSLAFLVFDCLVQRQQRSLITTATRQNAIVSSLFPKSIQKKLMDDMDAEAGRNKSGKAGLRSYLNDTTLNRDMNQSVGGDGQSIADGPKSKPIADLFPETTIMFADIAGFTAWSSTREPSQVFTLLEAIYHEFDTIAKRRRVFKVEVVGDCYVAVCGLPDPRRDHAVVMAKFANECLNRMYRMTRKLEVELGPDTAELGLRVGMHSGPVVAGVLRGDKSRFQLFGDTMNTASRMESTGTPNRIQVSQETAELVRTGGKEDWLTARETKVEAKGKGELQTYWLAPPDVSRSSDHSTTASMSDDEDDDERMADEILPDPQELEEKRNRVAEWTVEVLSSVLKVVVTARKSHGIKSEPRSKIQFMEKDIQSQNATGKTVIDEVAEVITLPDYNARKFRESTDVTLDPIVVDELRNYVQTIASLYNNNAFHNFDHANHVVMSVNKLFGRIIAPDLDDATEKTLHDHTYGITSDPLTWFAVVFAALIHDVDHTGVPNAQLVKEGAPVAALYREKSVAEQNSVDISWDLLMEPTYSNLRYTIYTTTAELKRFRQLVVNSVMATDIVDKEMKTMRNDRWANAFDPYHQNSSPGMVRTLKSTIVIEHLIQASDVAHTMQHWHIYRRWNEKFFHECYAAYKDGRAERNPADTWYEGEKGFFDFYIIPLAKKLKECGVFGVSSDEYLSYATQNRREWEERGEAVVKEMVRSVTKGERRSSGEGRNLVGRTVSSGPRSS